MVRYRASAADEEMIAGLAHEGIPVSHAQLERWRQHGLLSPSVVLRYGRGRGTAVRPHSEEVWDIVRILGEFSKRGTPWQRAGVALFAAGAPLREDALQASAVWLGEAVRQKLRQAWLDASATTATLGTRRERLEDVAFAAADCFIARRSCRGTWRHFRTLTREALPEASVDDVEMHAKSCLAMRIMDAAGAGPLSAEQLHVARFFSTRGESRLPPQPLVSERQMCANTLTIPEAYVFRELIVAQDTDLGDRALLDVVVWEVAVERLALEPEPGMRPRPDVPIPIAHLSELERDLRAQVEPAEG